MKTLYIECAMGAAGDMLTAALLELMPDKEAALAKLNAMGIPGVAFRSRAECKVRHYRHAYAGVDSWRGGRVLCHVGIRMRMKITTNITMRMRTTTNMSMCMKSRIAMAARITSMHGNICTSMRIPMAIMLQRRRAYAHVTMTDFLSTITTTNTTIIGLRMRITMRIMAWQRSAV